MAEPVTWENYADPVTGRTVAFYKGLMGDIEVYYKTGVLQDNILRFSHDVTGEQAMQASPGDIVRRVETVVEEKLRHLRRQWEVQYSGRNGRRFATLPGSGI